MDPVIQIGPYPVVGELGRGAAGIVYRARDASLGRDVALKLLTSLENPVRRERFRREALALAKLRHPNVVAIHHVGEHQGRAYMVLDLVEGETLQARLRRDGPLPPLEAARLVARLARALHHVHARGVVHRDVKPDNVLLCAGEPLLTDFGLAKDLDADQAHLSRDGYCMGTPGYWSPEQARGDVERIGPASDLYSLGATLYAALTGSPPLRGAGSVAAAVMATCDEVPAPASARRPGVPPGLDAVCARCLAKAPGERYATGDALADDLERVLARGDAPATGTARRPTRATETGRTIGRYELVAELARGGMGVVYRGRDPAIDREVAVKLFAIDERARPGALERFQREARAAGRLRHPGIVPIYDFGVAGTTAYLVMDLVVGETLADLLRRGGPLAPREAARLCEGVARTLSFAHEQGVVHRDIKPANVLVRGGQPLLVDFGIARNQSDASLSATGQLLGTPTYMAPEQLVGERGKVGPAADIYAVGGTLYELLTGAPPYDADNLLALISAKAREAPRSPAALRPDVDADLSAICLRCLAVAPEDRYPDAAHLARDLAAYLVGEEVLANPLGHGERAARWLRRRPIRTASIAAAAVLGLSSIAALVKEPPRGSTAVPEPVVTVVTTSEVPATSVVAAPPPPELLLERARALTAAGDLDRAVDDYEAALALLPPDDTGRGDVGRALGEVLLSRSRVASGARNFGSAVTDLERALQHDPRATGLWLELAVIHQATGDVTRRRDALDRLLSLEPRHVTALHLRGDLRSNTSDLRGAIEDFTRCLELAPAHTAALHGRAWARVLLGQGGERAMLEAALQDYTRSLELAPDDALTYQGRGYVNELLGDPGSAVADYERALKLFPADSPHRARSESLLGRARGGLPKPHAAGPEPGAVATAPDAGAALGDVQAWLDRAASGELAARPDGLQEAVWAIARHPRPEVVALLARTVEGTAGALLDAHDAWLRANAAEERGLEAALANRRSTPIGSHPERAATTILARAVARATQRARAPEAAAMRERVGQPRLDQARVACEALGRLGTSEGAVEALAAYVRAEPDPLRAVPAGLALVRLPGPRARRLALWSLTVQGLDSPYTRQLLEALKLAGPAEVGEGQEPEDAGSWEQLGRARYLQGDHAGAIEDLGRALELDERSGEAWALRGAARLALRDLTGAHSDFDRALELAPDNAMYWTNRGLVRVGLQDLAGALEDHTRALELDPKNDTAWSNRGCARQRQGDLAGAIEDHTRALELDPRRAEAWSFRGDAHRARGDAARAIEDYTRALELDARRADTLASRGEAWRERGDLTRAMADCARALELDPRNTNAWMVRGAARGTQRDLAGAIEDFTRALDLDPTLVAGWRSRGRTRGIKGDLDGALEDFTRALALDPRDAQTLDDRGRTRERRGDLAGARADFARVLELNPGHPEAARYRAVIAAGD
jgi:serine/threonine protein kinase/Flp pilus assembly protein TadD